MKTKSKIVLAIAPGGREFGVAVFQGTELIYFMIRALRNRKPGRLQKNEIVSLINGLIITFNPCVIAIKAISQYQMISPVLARTVRIIKQNAELSYISVAEIQLRQVSSALCDKNNRSQNKAFENLTAMYPELRHFLNRPNKSQRAYAYRLLSAVSVGYTALHLA